MDRLKDPPTWLKGTHPRNKLRSPTLGSTSVDFYHYPVTVWAYSTPQPTLRSPTGGAFVISAKVCALAQKCDRVMIPCVMDVRPRGSLPCRESEQQQRKLRSAMRTAGETSTRPMNTEARRRASTQRQLSADVTVAHSETSLVHSVDIYCHENCRHDRSGDGDMIPCCMCFRWHHEQCVTDGTIRQDTPWWLCPSCRSLPDTVRVMSDMIRSLQQNMDKILDSNTKLVNPVKDITVKNERLLAQISSLSSDGSKHSTKSSINVPNLLTGASTIRDVARTDPSAFYIISRGGRKNRWRPENS